MKTIKPLPNQSLAAEPIRDKSFLERFASKAVNAKTAALSGLASVTFNPFFLPSTISNMQDPAKMERIGKLNTIASIKGYLGGLGGLSYLIYKDATSENLRYWPVYTTIAATNLAIFVYSSTRNRKQ